jgi:cytochrome c-type biogenesis protein CcmH
MRRRFRQPGSEGPAGVPRVLLLLVLLLAAVPSPAAVGAETSATGVETPTAGAETSTAGGAGSATTVDEVARSLMDPCTDCRGKQLSGCDCGGALQAKQEIAALLAQGRSKEEIVQDFVARYGEWVLAAPEKKGFNLVGYLLPFALLAAGGGGLVLFLRRAVRRGGSSPGPAEDAISSDERARIEEELRALDP